jgi:molecular chaperone GrpE
MTTNSDELENEELSEEVSEEEAPAEESAPEAAAEESVGDIEAKLGAELASVKDQLLRTMAEYDNFRKRSAREKDALRADIITTVTSEFLPVLDNLNRALESECSDENYKNGVKMISDSFTETLKKLGVEEIESDGAKFDPSMHQAVQRVEDDTLESGTVAKTFAKGYKINDKVIRFAMVAVVN